MSVLDRRRRISCRELRSGLGDVEHLVLVSASIWVASLAGDGSTVPAFFLYDVGYLVLISASGWHSWPGVLLLERVGSRRLRHRTGRSSSTVPAIVLVCSVDSLAVLLTRMVMSVISC